jgi:hypothetical protein
VKRGVPNTRIKRLIAGRMCSWQGSGLDSGSVIIARSHLLMVMVPENHSLGLSYVAMTKYLTRSNL